MSYDILRIPQTMVSFNLRTQPILPSTYSNVVSLGVVGYPLTLGIEDVKAKYVQLLSVFPEMSPSFEKAEYVVIKHTSGALEVLCTSWIDETTIVSSQNVTRVVRIYNVPTSIDNKLTMSLRLLGLQDFNISDS